MAQVAVRNLKHDLEHKGGRRRQRTRYRRLAKGWAQWCYKENHRAHRGAFYCHGGLHVIFGNDGYEDERVKREIEFVKAALKDRGIPVLGFGRAFGYTWALLVRHAPTMELDRLVWDCWFEACSTPSRLREGAA